MIYKNFFKTLKSKGILFIGSTEQITTYRELGFERLSSFYFRKDVYKRQLLFRQWDRSLLRQDRTQ